MLKVGRDSLFWGMVRQEERLWGNKETRGCAEEKERNASCRSHLCWRRWCWQRANLPNHCLKFSNQERHKYCHGASSKGDCLVQTSHITWIVFSRNPLRKSMIVWVSQHSSSYACLDTPRMQMSLLMPWHGTSVPSMSCMEERELSWLHPVLLCTSVVVQQKKIDVIRKAEISPGKHNWKEKRQSFGQGKNSVSRAQSSRKTQTI